MSITRSLPAVMDLEKAVGGTLVHEDLGTNLCVACSRAGDPDRAFREADGVVSARLVQPASSRAPWNPGPWWPATNAAPT